MKVTQLQDQGKTRKQSRGPAYLITGIMLLLVSQLIIFLANSSSINPLPAPSAVDENVTLQDLQEVKTDLKKVRDKLETITAEPVTSAAKQPELTADAKPVPAEAVKAEAGEQAKETGVATPLPDKDIAASNPAVTDKADTRPVVVSAPAKVAPISKQAKKPKDKNSNSVKPSIAVKVPVAAVAVPDKAETGVMKAAKEVIENIDKPVATRPVYIKYDNNGEPVENDMGEWSCVFDTKSGLMWEVKSKEDMLRNPENLYSWFNPGNASLKGVVDGGRCKGISDCDTNAYIEAMNRKNFCGHNDWRLPTHEEMLGLVSYDNRNKDIRIDTSYFPNTLPSWYWTASTNASHPEYAWYVLFKNGMSLSDLKENPKHIRLVRGESS